MACFPMFIDITNKKCVVIGGGKVALRKVETLLRYDALVKVVGMDICEEIRHLLPAENVRTGQAGITDMDGAALVVAATGSRQVNHEAAVFCRSRNIPVNVVDAPEECTFLFPAIVKKGDISIGINTGGKSPLVSSRIRQDIDEAIPGYYADIARQMGELRKRVKKNTEKESERRKALKAVAAAAFAKESVLSEEEIDKIIRQVQQ